MRLLNIQLINKEKKVERDLYKITPRQSRQLAMKCGKKTRQKTELEGIQEVLPL